MASHRGRRRARVLRVLAARPLRAVLSLGLLLGIGSVASYAYWTDDVTVTGTTFTAGNLDLVVNGDTDDAVSFTALTITAMAPGNSTAGVLTVANVGSVPLKYSVATTATNADSKNLAGALSVLVTGAAAVTGTSPAASCGGPALTGTASTFAADLVTTKRQLAAGASETLCIQATLPTTADGSLQGATTSVTLTFNATSNLA